MRQAVLERSQCLEVAQSHAVRIACAGPRPAPRGFGQRTDDGAVYAQPSWLADAEQPIDGVHEVRVVEVVLAPVDVSGARPCRGGQLEETAAVVVADLRDMT